MGVRLYDARLGRFLQLDPIEGGSANDYDYANQDPNNQQDLDGNKAKKKKSSSKSKSKNKSARNKLKSFARSNDGQALKKALSIGSISAGYMAAALGLATVLGCVPCGAGAVVASRLSTIFSALYTILECSDGGPGIDCAFAAAATMLSAVGGFAAGRYLNDGAAGNYVSGSISILTGMKDL